MSNWFPPRSRPRAVEGGLKARSTRGAIPQTWWSERFIEVLEGIGMGNRLDQLPDVTVAVRDRPLTELLRPAYLALGHGDNRG